MLEMRLLVLCIFLILPFYFLSAQENYVISGYVVDNRTKDPIDNSTISIEGSSFSVKSNDSGAFTLKVDLSGVVILNITGIEYELKRIPVELEGFAVDIGTIFLEKDLTIEQTDNLITLTDTELLDDEVDSNTAGLLRATRDVFLSRAAFDFGQAFFRVRGYDSQNGEVLVNGISMNKMFDGRPQWNNWGGLNDVTRNQQFTSGLLPSDFTFGGILGNTNIDTRPSKFRTGTRLSSSASNRTYTGRLMATYTSNVPDKGLYYSFSGSRRWAKEGYVDGTLYDAYSFFSALEYQINKKNSFNFTGMFASNRRGRSSAVTEEVFELLGKRYNPYWGFQNGKIRNSRERKIAEPILMLNYFYESEKFSLNTGAAYQFGTNARSRLGYYNAPNPDATYYRYLPSFSINSPIGANFPSANLAKMGFLQNPQMDWPKLYVANSREKAAYVHYDDVVQDRQFTANTTGNWNVNSKLQTDFGVMYKKLQSNNNAEIQDLLGAQFHEDSDPFSQTLNDVQGEVRKEEGDIFNYRYEIDAFRFLAFTQFRYEEVNWNAFLSATYGTSGYQRDGLFQNERFLDDSFGKSDKVKFTNYGTKGGFTYKLTGRHWLTFQGALLTQAPVLQNVFINPRENNRIVPDLQSETVSTVDLNYFLRLPKLTGRFTSFYTRFQNMTDINFFFVDAGVGSDFVQEVLTDLDKLHMGVEVGLEYQLSSAVKLSFVGALGKYRYASYPNVSINFDTAGSEEDLINPDGFIDLGPANIKDYNLAQGPQMAFAFGVEYRDPKYWWLAVTANHLGNNYAAISTITRTSSFYLNPETGAPFSDATVENVNKLLEQNELDDFYLLNLVGGKSWLKKGKYISIFASVNNVFDAVFKTGGYEQSRNGNFGQLKQDNLSGSPSFAPKYWYGYGRTYFLNVAFSF
tara:strand:+ start:278331 stop:281069 length:2739 start_codon:yes stop_codon:yes gene_type:complete